MREQRGTTGACPTPTTAKRASDVKSLPSKEPILFRKATRVPRAQATEYGQCSPRRGERHPTTIRVSQGGLPGAMWSPCPHAPFLLRCERSGTSVSTSQRSVQLQFFVALSQKVSEMESVDHGAPAAGGRVHRSGRVHHGSHSTGVDRRVRVFRAPVGALAWLEEAMWEDGTRGADSTDTYVTFGHTRSGGRLSQRWSWSCRRAGHLGRSATGRR